VTSVLVIDDEEQIRRFLRISLERKDCQVSEAATGFDGLQAVLALRPDLVLLDLGLPDRDGSAVLAELRSWSEVPVIVLSVRDSEAEIVRLLEAGADDYVTKPFSVGELLARMRVALRHRRAGTEPLVRGDLVVDFEGREVRVDGTPVRLTPTEYAVLAAVAKGGGRIVTQAAVLREVWGPIADMEQGSLRVHVSAIRRKIERDPSRPVILVTEPGIGYRIGGEDEA
jgi:two-component system KDP operon response regulator KdpE